jgi:hypothetical protein
VSTKLPGKAVPTYSNPLGVFAHMNAELAVVVPPPAICALGDAD